MKTQAIKMAKSFGVELQVQVDSAVHGLYAHADAPDGKHWQATGTSCLVADMPDARMRGAEWLHLMEDMSLGLMDCKHGGCEACE